MESPISKLEVKTENFPDHTDHKEQKGYMNKS